MPRFFSGQFLMCCVVENTYTWIARRLMFGQSEFQAKNQTYYQCYYTKYGYAFVIFDIQVWPEVVVLLGPFDVPVRSKVRVEVSMCAIADLIQAGDVEVVEFVLRLGLSSHDGTEPAYS
jgi:hypothetical protein